MGLRTLPRWLLVKLKRRLGIEQRLTREESCNLMQLAGAILDYARLPPSYQSTIRTKSAIVEVTDLSYRFREKPDAITAALSLMKEMGFAQELKQKGIWRIQLVKRASYKDSNHNEGAA